LLLSQETLHIYAQLHCLVKLVILRQAHTGRNRRPRSGSQECSDQFLLAVITP